MEGGIREDVKHHLVNLVVSVALDKQVALGGENVVLICAAAGSGVYKGSPLYESPACVSVVGVVGDSVGIVANELQILNELLGSGGELGNASICPNLLIVADTACNSTQVSDTVNIAVISLLVSPVVLLIEFLEGSERFEEVAEVHNLNCIRDHENIAVISGVHHCGNIGSIISKALILNLAVVSFLESLCHLCEGAVLDTVGTVCEHLQSQTVSSWCAAVCCGRAVCCRGAVCCTGSSCTGIVCGAGIVAGASGQAENSACCNDTCHCLCEFHVVTSTVVCV